MKTDRNLKLFGQRIQTLRKAKGLKQAELAEKANLNSWEQVSKIERGVSGTNLKTIVAIAAALGTSLSELFDFSLEDVKDREKSATLKQLVSFLLQQDTAFIRYVHEQAKVATDHWKKK